MGRGATKAQGNVWYEARIKASKWNDRLSSRAGAAELLNVSEDVIKDTELDLYKNMPVETAVRMADLYGEPGLRNYYCIHECPIGRHHSISDSVPSLDRATVKIINMLRADKLEHLTKVLLDIAEDGVISDDELPMLGELAEWLDDASKIISEMRIIVEKRRKGSLADGHDVTV